MKDVRAKHHRRSLRLRNYDYSRSGAYFITICTHNGMCLFGETIDDMMRINKFGQVVDSVWPRTSAIRPVVKLDEYIVMSNHVHAILIIDNPRRGVLQYAPTSRAAATFRSRSQTVGAIVRGFKSAAAKRINEIRETPEVSVWQRNYYEHVIRNEKELSRIREYIANNPAQWTLDRENPAREDRRGVLQYAPISQNNPTSADAPTDAIESIFGGFRP